MKYSIIIPTGLMLFSFFFGAGNLIFPPTLGQQAGNNFISATLGFCLTGVGLPLLGIYAFALIKSYHPDDISRPVSDKFARYLTILCALTIGPFFAIPRTAATSYDMGIAPLLNSNNFIGLACYSAFFFITAYYLSIKRSALIDNIGKIITPVLLISFLSLILCVLFKPMGNLQVPVAVYNSIPFLKGFQEGYNTMDLLCAMLFGPTLAIAIQDKGITESREFLKIFILASIVAGSCLTIIYLGLTYAGAVSVAAFGQIANGGILLNMIAVHYMGFLGKLILAILIFCACITTTIGLNVAISEYFSELPGFPSYNNCVRAICLFSFVVANIGLTAIIKLSIPVIFFLYPIIIAIILLNIFEVAIKRNQTIFRCCIFLTTVFAFCDGLKAAGLMSEAFNKLLTNYLPFYGLGFGWFCPSICGLIIGFLLKTKY